MNRFIALVFISIIALSCNSSKEKHNVILWYDKPAAEWDEALPIGIDNFSAMVFGGIKTEQLQLNEITLYSGEPSMRHVEIDVTKNLEKVKALIKGGRLDEVNKIAGDEWIGRAQD